MEVEGGGGWMRVRMCIYMGRLMGRGVCAGLLRAVFVCWG